MNNQQPPLDPISILAALLTGAIGAPALGYQIAAYAAITAAALVGSLIANSRREGATSGWAFVPLMTATTVLIAEGVSELVAVYSAVRLQTLLIPISLGIAAIGQDWLTVHKWGPMWVQRVRGWMAGRGDKTGDKS